MLRSRVGKDGTYHIYDGNKKATIEQEKEWIRDNAKHSLINEELLSKQQRSYYGKVKGGINRAGNSLYNEDTGKFLTAKQQKQVLGKLGINLADIMEKKGYKTLRELIANEPLANKKITGIMYYTKFQNWYNSHTVVDTVDSFSGEVFNINGQSLNRHQASKLVNKTIKAARNHFGATDCIVRFVFTGIKELTLTIPTNDVIQDYDEDGYVEFNQDWKDNMIVFVSEKPTTKRGKKK